MRICEGLVVFIEEICEGWYIECNRPLITVKRYGNTSLTNNETGMTKEKRVQ